MNGMGKRTLLALFVIAIAVASLRPIRSYDFFWHLATGRWIVENRALPLHDPFGVASDHIPWINDEWLFEIAAYAAWSVGGIALITILRSCFLATIAGLSSLAEETSAGLAFAAIGWYGSRDLLGERPSTIGALLFLVVLKMTLAERIRWLPLKQALLTVVWINVHPSALLSPVLASIRFVGSLAGKSEDRRQEAIRSLETAALSAVALFINPFGIRGVLAPLHLVSTIRAGSFVNREWLPSLPSTFPLFYVTLAGAFIILLASHEGSRRPLRILLLLSLAVLAVRFVRNQPFWFVGLAPLVTPSLPSLKPSLRHLLAVATGVAILLAMAGRPPALGIDDDFFPVAPVRQLAAMKTKGSIFNADQFGGFLIWTFYGERRVLQDGRNELYTTYLAEYDRARRDSRLWDALLAKYRIDVAVEEYHSDPIDVINPTNGTHVAVPSSLVFFPRHQWALVAFDDVGMVFIRRGSRNPIPFEYRALVPDDPRPQWTSAATRLVAAHEIEIARRTTGESRRLERLEAALAP